MLNLRWRDIGTNAINLRDSQTGPRAVPLGEAARAHIQMLRGARDPEAYLFPRHAEGRGQSSLTACWRAVCEDAKLGRLRLHDLRHTAASHAVMSGENLPLVGELLGHRRHRTTGGNPTSPTGTWSRWPKGLDASSHARWKRVRHANQARRRRLTVPDIDGSSYCIHAYRKIPFVTE